MKCWRMWRTRTGRRTAKVWRWSVTFRKTIIGVWSIPSGKVLLDGINWISHPKISPDGKWIAFADHENPGGDDEGSLAVIGADGGEQGEGNFLSGWTSLQGILWSPAGDEIWFTSTNSGSASNPRAVTLSGKVRTITNVPGGVWIEDLRNGTVLMVIEPHADWRSGAWRRVRKRSASWGGLDGRSCAISAGTAGRFCSRKKATAAARITPCFCAIPMARLQFASAKGTPRAISPDGKWVITEPAKGGLPEPGADGSGRSQATHARCRELRLLGIQFLPDGKRLLASGIEAGHGGRDYLIDLSNGDSKAITPEGIVGDFNSRPMAGARGARTRREAGNLVTGRGRRHSSDTGARTELLGYWLDAGRGVGVCGS